MAKMSTENFDIMHEKGPVNLSLVVWPISNRAEILPTVVKTHRKTEFGLEINPAG